MQVPLLVLLALLVLVLVVLVLLLLVLLQVLLLVLLWLFAPYRSICVVEAPAPSQQIYAPHCPRPAFATWQAGQGGRTLWVWLHVYHIGGPPHTGGFCGAMVGTLGYCGRGAKVGCPGAPQWWVAVAAHKTIHTWPRPQSICNNF